MTATRSCFTNAKCDINNCLTNIDLNVGDFNQQVNLRLAAAHPGFCCWTHFTVEANINMYLYCARCFTPEYHMNAVDVLSEVYYNWLKSEFVILL